MKTKNKVQKTIEVAFPESGNTAQGVTIRHHYSPAEPKRSISELFRARYNLPWEQRFEGTAGEELMTHVHDYACRYCGGDELKDVVQETILQIHAKMDDWISEAGFEAIGLKIWGEVRNCLRQLRQVRNRLTSEANKDETLLGLETPCEESNLVFQFEMYLAQKFGNGDLRVLLVRKIYQGYNIQEFLDRLGIDRKVFYRILRRELAQAWNKAFPDDAREMPRKCA